ncbi:hypothetical protein SALBM135S_10125 [Streptomyces alboniger]
MPRGAGRLRGADQKREEATGAQCPVDAGEERGAFGGQEVAEGSEADGQVVAPANGRARASARTRSTAGPPQEPRRAAAAAAASIPALKSTPVTRSRHSGSSVDGRPVPQHT